MRSEKLESSSKLQGEMCCVRLLSIRVGIAKIICGPGVSWNRLWNTTSLIFPRWKDDVKFEGMFRKLIDGLELFYKG